MLSSRAGIRQIETTIRVGGHCQLLDDVLAQLRSIRRGGGSTATRDATSRPRRSATRDRARDFATVRVAPNLVVAVCSAPATLSVNIRSSRESPGSEGGRGGPLALVSP